MTVFASLLIRIVNENDQEEPEMRCFAAELLSAFSLLILVPSAMGALESGIINIYVTQAGKAPDGDCYITVKCNGKTVAEKEAEHLGHNSKGTIYYKACILYGDIQGGRVRITLTYSAPNLPSYSYPFEYIHSKTTYSWLFDLKNAFPPFTTAAREWEGE